MLFIEYPKCSTCQKAKAYLDEKKVEYIDRNIKTDNPTFEELNLWYHLNNDSFKGMINTSGLLYKELGLKEKLPNMNKDEIIKLLSSDGMLVKRPIVVLDDLVIFGFKKELYDKLK